MQRMITTFPALIVAILLTLAPPLSGRAGAVTLLRDPDIENALNQLAKPVISAAGLSPARVKILVIRDRTLNAFIVDQRHIFIHSGLIMQLKTPEELQAVIAHEAAHMASGHIARRVANARTANTVTGLGMALAAMASASGNSKAAAALGLGVASSANRVFMGHTRAEESSADQSSIRYMARAGVDPTGAVRVMEIFKGQELVSAARQDPYARTHPLSRDRVRHLEAIAGTYAGRFKPDPAARYWFSRAKGKLTAFERAPKWTRKTAGDSASEDIRLMRLAVAYHRDSSTKQAVATMQKLLKLRSKDPYYHELLGQILLESRNFSAAVNAYRNAVALAPRDALILGAYGRALLAVGNPKAAREALLNSRARDQNNAQVLRDLGQAHSKLGQPGLAALATAERYALSGRLHDAGTHARRAAGLLPRGSAGWQRAQDVLSAAEAAKKK